ncbi:glycosyltransferase [Rufibacter sediminis]|uniref:Glycosyltransferase n=1 Tax=Rufibacter sediminis TaxID=2762756 RepID=A0ABR6VNM7_9BACT|nr:glycosyltransferase [Rufibacter sediminis]MBC3538515.1 glycosyltransferase [Rufibacter sediminis]
MKILFIVPYPYDKAPSQRLKFEQYVPIFKQKGYQIEYSTFYDEKAWSVIYKKGNFFNKVLAVLRGYFRRIGDLFRLREYDLVYVHLWVTPIGPPIFEWIYSKVAKTMIYDIDDLVFLNSANHMAWWKKILSSGKKPIYLMKHSGHVFTGTPYLNDFAKKHNPNSTDISVTMDTDRYIPVNTYTNGDKVVVGWSGSISTAPYLYLLQDVLKEVNSIHPFKLLVIGDRRFNIEGLDIETLDWTQEKEIPTLQRMDIGLYPLPLDDEWVLGKSGGKALQYMAVGVPAIATAIGANYRVIEDGVSGFLVKTKEEWKEKLLYLLQNPDERKRIGLAGRERIEEYFSVKNNASVYLKVLQDVI